MSNTARQSEVGNEVKPKPRPALRLVKTNDLSRAEWLDVRKQGIGSSDAAAAVGLNPYKSQLELWLEKTGRSAGLPQPDPDDDESPLFWGTLLEPIVAARYAKRTGNKVRRVNAVLQHPDHHFMLANLDREVMGNIEVAILECKTAGLNGARLWKDGVPEYVQIQVMHQLAVTGKQAADVAALIAGQKLEIFRIERDEVMIQNLIKLEQQFWQMVESDTPPDPDGSDSAARALQHLYPHSDEAVVDYRGDTEMERCFGELVTVRQKLAEFDEMEAKLKQQIQQRMGTSGKAMFTTGEITWRKTRDGIVLDTGRLLKDQPDLMQTYSLVRAGSRRFVVSSNNAQQ